MRQYAVHVKMDISYPKTLKPVQPAAKIVRPVGQIWITVPVVSKVTIFLKMNRLLFAKSRLIISSPMPVFVNCKVGSL